MDGSYMKLDSDSLAQVMIKINTLPETLRRLAVLIAGGGVDPCSSPDTNPLASPPFCPFAHSLQSPVRSRATKALLHVCAPAIS